MNHAKSPVVEVALQLGNRLSALTYLRPKSNDADESLLGRRVQVSVGRRTSTGIVTREGDIVAPPGVKLKEIDFVIDEAPVLTKNQLALAHFVADYYEASFFDAVKLCLPRASKVIDAKVFAASDEFRALLKAQFGHKGKTARVRRAQLHEFGFDDTQIKNLLDEGKIAFGPLLKNPPTPFHEGGLGQEKTLSEEQQLAVDTILNEKSKAFLLEGVTGSGKTEVYLAVAKAVLADGKSVLFIVPEIALTPQLIARVRSGLCEDPVVIHSHVSSSDRDDALDRIRDGSARFVIGARSALFCPAQKLGLIVVDEEHDNGFKQDDSPRYHARDVALWRANHEGAKIILGSATPSLECLYNVEKGRLKHLQLTKRVGTNAMMPAVSVIDLCERRAHDISRLKDRSASHGPGLCILSSPLRTAIEETLAKKQQVILFLNRRGWASYLICGECGTISKCPNCSISLTYHKKSNQLLCHQCSYTKAFSTKCASCPDGVVTPLGLGTERVEKELQLSFPAATVARFDKESMRNPRDLEKTLERLHSGEIQILIGTQMIAKGHDFPHVTLVGVILADSGLGIPDFRASERSFQLLTQVAGRAGRRETQGRVLIQTFNPEHPAVVFAQNHDVAGFSKLELEERKQFFYPPYSRAALIRIEAITEGDAETRAHLVREALDAQVTKHRLSGEVAILGPAPCANVKLRKYFRWQVFIKAKTVASRKILLRSLREDEALSKQLNRNKGRLVIDVDPVQML